MAKLALIALALLPLGLVVIGAGATWLALRKVRNADAAWSPSWRVLFWARIWTLILRVPWASELAVLHNEGASVARPPTRRELDFFDDPPSMIYPFGDVDNRRGPSVGPGQVLRSNIVALYSKAGPIVRFFVKAAAEPVSLALVGNERAALWASVMVLREEYENHGPAAGGNDDAAIRAYNGTNAASLKYAQRARSFIDRFHGQAPATEEES